MDREVQALFALVRAGLWGRYDEAMASVFPLSSESWERVFSIARQQTVTGIAFRGLDFLPSDAVPPMGLMVKWMAYADRIEQSNLALNETLAMLCRHFSASGETAVLQKGPGVAMMYPEPLLRECGDIDLFFPGKDEDSDPLQGIPGAERELKPDGSWEYHVGDVIVERHSYLVDVLAPGARKFVNSMIEEKGYEEVNIAGCPVSVPVPEVNLLLLSSHILKHALGVGIGLRQVCDMDVACRFYAGRVDPQKMREIYRKAGLEKWAGLLDDFMIRYLDPDCRPVIDRRMQAEKAKKSDILLDIILKGGNFGRFTEKQKRASGNVVSRKWRTFMSFIGNLRFALAYAPGEWFWTMVQLTGGQMR